MRRIPDGFIGKDLQEAFNLARDHAPQSGYPAASWAHGNRRAVGVIETNEEKALARLQRITERRDSPPFPDDAA